MAKTLTEEEEYAIRKDIQRSMELGDGTGELNARRKLMDFETGASLDARALIGSAATMEDKIATARKFYPDAKPYGDDNIVFTNPETNRKTLVNPKGIDVGDVAGAGREIAQVAGGFLGGAVGSLAGPLGTAAGGALGSQIAGQASDALNRMMGTVETRSGGRIAAEGAMETLAETFFGKAAEGLPLFLSSIKNKVIGPIRSSISGQGAAQTLEDLQKSGIPIEGAAGAVGSGSTSARNITKVLSVMPGSSGIMDEAAKKTLEGATEAHRNLASSIGPVMTPEGAGTVIKEGMEDAAGRFKERRMQLDERVSELLPEGVSIIKSAGTPPGQIPTSSRTVTTVVPRVDQVSIGPPMTVNNTEVPGGKIFKAFDEDGGSIEGQFTVVDVDKLITSNLPDYPKELQPRDRTRAASDFVVNKISKRLNPELLGDSPLISQGAPIIGVDGVVESGNGRVMAIRKSYQDGNAKEYKNHIIENASVFGVPAESIQGMAKPVLVRIRTTPLDYSSRKAFTQKANNPSIASFSPAENAAKDSEYLPSMSGLDIENPQDLLLIKNSSFVQGFFKKALSDNELGSVMDSRGRLSSAGFNRLKTAIFSKAYGVDGGSVVARLSESLDDNVKNVTSGMLTAAPKISNMMQKINRGDLYPLGISSEISEAADKLSQLRSKGITVADEAKQGELFGEKKDPVIQELLGVFERFGNGHKKISEFLSRYADEVDLIGSPKQKNLFDDTPSLSKLEIIKNVNKQMEREYGEQFIVPSSKSVESVSGKTAKQAIKKQIVLTDTPAPSRLTEERESAVRAKLPALTSLLGSVRAKYKKAPESLSHLKSVEKEIEDILVDAVNGKMDIRTLRSIRTKIGSQTEFGGLYTGPLKKPGQEIYHALKQDIADLATEASPEAGAALRLHDRYTRFYNSVREPVINDIIKKETGEQVWHYARSFSAEGGSKLRAIKKNLRPAEWDVVAATTLHRMGLGLPGSQNVAGDMFRHSTFFTNWSKLSKEAKEELFGGTRYKDMVEPLNRLVRVSASLKELDTAINSSNTATATTWMNLLKSPSEGVKFLATAGAAGTAFTFAPVAVTVASVVLGVAGPYAMAKVWTNPNFIKWMASTASISRDVSGPSFEKFISTQAARLLYLSGDDEEKQVFNMIYRTMTGKKDDKER